MCGIVGFIDKKNSLSLNRKKGLIAEMRKIISHRGSDDFGEHIDRNIALGHARLSIIDLSEKGRQPMISTDKNSVISYNGEIYNYKNLNKLLKSQKFQSSSDTETILNGYEKWNLKLLEKMKGMWAFGFLDKKSNELILSVDRFGIKPLYFINNENWLAFSSEIKALFTLPGVKPKINFKALPEYLTFRTLAGKKTMFENIEKILPSQWMRINLKNFQSRTGFFWEIRKKRLKQKNHEKELLKIIKNSVADHLIADVPVGIQLSGGVDSGLIAALAAKTKKSQLHSFSIGLSNPDWNEFNYSKEIAEKIKTRHHQLVFNEKDFCQNLPKLTYHMDEPISHPHSVPMYLLAKTARHYVKALLSGEGADEIFGGYRRYEKLFGKKKNNKFISDLSRFSDEKIMKGLTSLNLKNVDKERIAILKKIGSRTDDLQKTTFLDIKTYLTPLLVRQDKMGMAATLENRVPFLDHELAEFGFSLPRAEKLKNDENTYFRTKPLLKKIASKFIPPESIYRQKCGFGLPISQWLKNPNGLGKYLNLFKNPQPKRPYLRYPAIRKLIKEHLNNEKNHGETLWILINLELWTKIFIDRKNPSTIWASLQS